MSSVSSTSDQLNHYNKVFRELQQDVEEQQKRSRELDAERADKLEAAYKRDLDKQRQDAEDTIENVRSRSNETLEAAREYHKNQYKDLKDSYDRSGRYSQDDGAVALRKQLEDAHRSAEVQSRMTDQKLDTAREGLSQKLKDSMRDAEEQTAALRASHREETDRLREEMKVQGAAVKRDSEVRSEALAEDTRKNENAWILKERFLSSEHDKELNNLRAKQAEVEHYMGQSAADTLRQKDAYYADMFRRQNAEGHHELSRMNTEFGTQINNMERQRKLENEAAYKSTQAQLATAHEQQENALTSQAKSYQELISRSREQNKAETAALEKSIHAQANSSDTLLIPPAAENTVRRSVIREYEKQFDAEKKRHKDSTDSLQQSAQERLHDAIWMEQEKLTTAVRDGAAERAADRGTLLGYIQESDMEKKSTLKEMEIEHERESHNMSRNYGMTLERQRRDYESMIENQRNDSLSKIQTLRQEGEFRSRMQQREAQARQTEMMREHEKKLADQKMDLQGQIEELKSKAQNDMRDMERKSKQGLEEQARQYEQRIAQMEAQHKERETSNQNRFQEEIDRVRRANEIFIKKKG